MDHIIILLDDHTRQIHFSFLFFELIFLVSSFRFPLEMFENFVLLPMDFQIVCASQRLLANISATFYMACRSVVLFFSWLILNYIDDVSACVSVCVGARYTYFRFG